MIFSINESMISNNDISVVREDYEGLSFYESCIQMYTELMYEFESGREILSESLQTKLSYRIKSWLSKILGIIDRFTKEVTATLQVIRTKLIKPNIDKLKNAKWQDHCKFEDYDYRKIDKFINSPLPDIKSKGPKDYDRARGEHGTNHIFLEYKNRKEVYEKVLGDKITIDAKYVSDIDPLKVIQSFSKEYTQIKMQERESNKFAKEMLKELNKKDGHSIDQTQCELTLKFNSFIVPIKLSLIMHKLNQAYKIVKILARNGAHIEYSDNHKENVSKSDDIQKDRERAFKEVKDSKINLANNHNNRMDEIRKARNSSYNDRNESIDDLEKSIKQTDELLKKIKDNNEDISKQQEKISRDLDDLLASL